MFVSKPTENGLIALAIAELKKCKEDPVYFICKYIKVVHPVRGLVSFELYPFQKRILKEFISHRFNVLRKFRQAGCTTLACAYALWFCLFNPKKTVAVLSKGDAESTEFLDRIKIMHDELPPFMRQELVENNKHTLRFTNKSMIKSRASGKQSGRSLSGSLLILDEAAFIENMKTIWAACLPSISCVTKDTFILTDKGYTEIGDFFYPTDKEESFKPLSINVVGKEGLELTTSGYVSKRSNTLKLKTRLGVELEVTEKHPLYSLVSAEGPEMIQAQELRVGNYVRIDHSMGIFGSLDIPNDEAYMLGGYIAEGWSISGNGKYGIWISNSDPEFREIYLRNGYRPVNNTIKVYKGTKLAIANLTSYGINPTWKCDTKRVPKKILEATKKSQGLFLRGLFDGDGHATKKGEICLVSTSKQLVKEVQLILLNFGIISTIRFTSKEKLKIASGGRLLPSGKLQKSFRDCYKLSITRGFAKIFLDEIGFQITRKRERLEKLILSNKDCNKVSSVPKKYIKDKLFEIIEKVDFPLNKFRKYGIRLDKILDSKTNREVPIFLLTKIKNFLSINSPSLIKEYSEFFDEFCRNSTWDEIISIRNSINNTVDLTVPETSTFLQNGILGSNTGGKVIVLSTVNGIANWFFEIYSGAIKKTNSFHAIDITWKEHPEYFRHSGYDKLYSEMMQRTPPKNIDLWEQEMRSNLKPKEWKQEFEAAFLGTGETYIDGETLEQIVANTSNEFYERYDGRLRIWKPPIPGRVYVLAADCSLGRGYDNSAFHVLDVGTGNQVAEFYSDSTPINEFSKIIALEGFRYNTANVIVERNTIGFILIQQLLETHEYDNVWFDDKGEPGIMINQKNREQLLGLLEENLRLGRVKINSDRTSYELLTFIINDSTHKPEADEGKTDDLVMSLAFAVEATKLMPFIQEIEKVEEEFKPMMGIMRGNNSKYTLSIRLPHGGVAEEDYSWILKN